MPACRTTAACRTSSKEKGTDSRLERITANLQRGFNADSKEMAKELEDSEVVDALGNEAREEIAKISAALRDWTMALRNLF